MLPRAAALLETIAIEFRKRDRAIEQDQETTKITIELIIGRRSGAPVKVRYLTSAECDVDPIR